MKKKIKLAPTIRELEDWIFKGSVRMNKNHWRVWKLD
jgi:hypothetical protein